MIELRWGNLIDITDHEIDRIEIKFNQVIIFEHFKYPVARTPLYFAQPYYELLMDICKFQIPIIFGIKPGLKDFMTNLIKMEGDSEENGSTHHSGVDLTNETIRKNI